MNNINKEYKVLELLKICIIDLIPCSVYLQICETLRLKYLTIFIQ